MSVKSSVSLGTASQSMKLLGDLGVDEGHVQTTIDDIVRRASVAAAYTGNASLAQVSFDDVFAREVSFTKIYCEIAGLPLPGNDMIEKSLRQQEAKHGSISANSRFVLGGLGLPELFKFFYRFNELQKDGNKPTLKLAHEVNDEWWRTDRNVQHIPTKPGVFTWDFRDTMRATDLAGRPFYLNAGDQDAWAKECGGNGRSTVEQITFLFQRCLLETGLPMWGLGSLRGLNSYGSGRSLDACFFAADGFYVDVWNRSARSWDLGALQEVFLALVS